MKNVTNLFKDKKKKKKKKKVNNKYIYILYTIHEIWSWLIIMNIFNKINNNNNLKFNNKMSFLKYGEWNIYLFILYVLYIYIYK